MPTEKKRRHRGPEKDKWRTARRQLDRGKRRRPSAQTFFPWYVAGDEGLKEGGTT
jgi:hypothetical protein